jgi:rubrerythrin
MDPKCVHSCRGLCRALEVAERREMEALASYREYAALCDYPDVREVLESLARDREKALATVREQREILTTKFRLLDNINDSFA